MVSQHWDALKQSAGTEHSVGENTRKFWDTCPNKFAVSLNFQERNILATRDSLLTSSITMSTRPQRAELFASKSLTAMLKSSDNNPPFKQDPG